jgi:hypothetical protein
LIFDDGEPLETYRHRKAINVLIESIEQAYHPFDATSLQGWVLDQNQHYQEIIPDHRGWLWCQPLGLWLGVWTGSIQREVAPWLRFYDRDGNLILLPAELAEIERQRAETEYQRAELLAARLRELGENPEF